MSTRTTRRSITLLLLASALLAARPTPARADSYPRQPGIDVRAYVFRLELKDDTSAISAEADIDVALKADGVRELWLDLVGSSPDGKTGMIVERVTSEGRPLVYSQEKNRIRIELGTPSKTGDRRRVTVRYRGTPADGLLVGSNRDGDRVFFGDNFPDRARHWLPTIDHPSAKAACEFAITAPETYQVVAPGALVETTSLTGGRRLTRYREEVPITTYCMVIGVGRFAVETIGQVGGAPVQSWVYASERDPGFSDFRIALQPMQLYSWRIGAFPYEKLANVQSKTRYGGMENASAIFYAEGVVTGHGRNANLFAHEIAHQWFGDSVTESDWDHTWLSEGFATYLTHVYNEYTAGRDAMVRGLRRDRDTVVRYNMKNPAAAVVTPADAALDNILSTNSYQKGGWVLHMLRRLVGDDAFWKGLAAYYARFRNANALTDDFRRVMEEVSGKPLEGFFRQWAYTPGQPLIQGSWSYANGVLTVRLEQAQAAGIVFDTPLDIGIVTDRAAAPRVETVPLGQRAQTFTFPVDKGPLDVVLDPNTWLLAQFGRFEKS
jgi:aminopeptidase N